MGAPIVGTALNGVGYGRTERLDLRVGQDNELVLRRGKSPAYYLDAPEALGHEVHFQFDSAIVLPGGLEVYKDVLGVLLDHQRAQEPIDLTIVGHTDAVGTRRYNQALSARRARSARHVLLGEEQDWVALVLAHDAALRAQALLEVLRFAADPRTDLGWSCDPGPEPAGPELTRDQRPALRAFFRKLGQALSLPVPPRADLEQDTWRMVFAFYQWQARARVGLSAAELRALQEHTLGQGPRVEGLGEDFPRHTTDAENRRVEFVYTAPADTPRRAAKLYEPRAFEQRELRRTGAATFGGAQLPAGNLVFVIDASGSMDMGANWVSDAAQSRLTWVQRELVTLIESIGGGRRFSILAFNDEVRRLDAPGALPDTTAQRREQARSWVYGLQAGGGTSALDLALRAALEVPDVDRIVLLSDGQPSFPAAEPAARAARDRVWDEALARYRRDPRTEWVRERGRSRRVTIEPEDRQHLRELLGPEGEDYARRAERAAEDARRRREERLVDELLADLRARGVRLDTHGFFLDPAHCPAGDDRARRLQSEADLRRPAAALLRRFASESRGVYTEHLLQPSRVYDERGLTLNVTIAGKFPDRPELASAAAREALVQRALAGARRILGDRTELRAGKAHTRAGIELRGGAIRHLGADELPGMCDELGRARCEEALSVSAASPRGLGRWGQLGQASTSVAPDFGLDLFFIGYFEKEGVMGESPRGGRLEGAGNACGVAVGLWVRQGGELRALGEAELAATVAHELAHFLGLPHCAAPGNLMQERYDGGTELSDAQVETFRTYLRINPH